MGLTLMWSRLYRPIFSTLKMEAVCYANDGNYVPVCTASQANCYRHENLKSLVHFACHLHKLAGLLLAKMANRLYRERQTKKQRNKQPNQTRHFGRWTRRSTKPLLRLFAQNCISKSPPARKQQYGTVWPSLCLSLVCMNVTPFILVVMYWLFWETYCIHILAWLWELNFPSTP